ncbi:MAG: flavin reductase family protein [Cryomorphaceae bacterium]|jgi:flavin reductase (DIM6/NTAB) family NADH-FMN oxidoreductase RutF|nr:flavin reductase family protein [Cryomorphaceae bacterium]
MALRRIDRPEIEKMERVPRLNLINSCTGYKSANLIATISNEGRTNVAVFSSITHLGSDPALISFTLRPTTVPRHTYKNIKEYGYFSVNHITAEQIADAHHTSAAYPEEISEFDQTKLEPIYHNDCPVPFVKGSPVKLLCKYMNEYLIQENGCLLVVASIEAIFYEEQLLTSDHWLQLDKGKVVAINGLDGYALPELLERFAFARPVT